MNQHLSFFSIALFFTLSNYPCKLLAQNNETILSTISLIFDAEDQVYSVNSGEWSANSSQQGLCNEAFCFRTNKSCELFIYTNIHKFESAVLHPESFLGTNYVNDIFIEILNNRNGYNAIKISSNNVLLCEWTNEYLWHLDIELMASH